MTLLNIKKDGYIRASELDQVLAGVAEVLGDEMKQIRREIKEIRRENDRLRRDLETERRHRLGSTFQRCR